MKHRSQSVASSRWSSSVRAVDVERVDANDQRRDRHADDRDDEQRDRGDGDDRVRGFLVAVGEVAHEQREQSCGEDAPEQQLVEDVRRLVRVRVDAGDRRGAERVRDGRDPPEAGESRDRRPDADDGARAQQPARPGWAAPARRRSRLGGAGAASSAAPEIPCPTTPRGTATAEHHQDDADRAHERRPDFEPALRDREHTVNRSHLQADGERTRGSGLDRDSPRGALRAAARARGPSPWGRRACR